ncbi:transglutaminase TgpA family protein [Lysobacter sp. A3-1-A15]|uniref:transglutaminase TgpA family protein n=1 Tax=Novilysobacter viscosus TaxID=3098602 RepID=UPI002ED852F7
MADARPSIPLDAATRRGVVAAAAAGLLPLLLQLPQAIGLTIATAAVVITGLSWKKPLPAPLRLLLTLALLAIVFNLTGFSLGRDSGSALLAAMLAAKPSETFQLRDARSLLGFALFAPFAAFLLDQGPVPLALGLLAAVVVLLALSRLADLESGETGRPAELRHRLLAIGRLMAIGLPLALAAFWLFPRLSTPLWGVPERSLARTGLSDTMRPGEWIDLMSDDSPALRVQFFGETPDRQQMYWRGPVLWDFDGREWTQPGWFRGLPAAPMEPGAVRWDYRIELEPTEQRQLVALDLPLAAPEGARLSLDHGLHVRRALTSLTRWRIQSAPPQRYEPELRRVLRSAALHLPEGFNPRTLALARRWRREAGANDVAIVERAMAWIRSDFAYTLGTPLLGRHSVDEFLFDEQAGFCEHFSSSFVVLMRAAGIPARVVTGYTGGYYNRFGDYWVVRRLDAHAWAEVWLEGPGWVRVDPTAAVAPERIYDTIDDRAGGAGGLFGDARGLAPMLDMTDWMRRGWNDFVLGFDANRQRQMFRPLGLGDLDGSRLAALFALVAAIALLWMAWLSRRGEREPDPVLRAWHALGQRYARLGLERPPHETARDWAARVGRARPHQAAELNALSEELSNWRYAAHTPGRDASRDLVRRLRAHRPSRPQPAPPNGDRR